MSIENSYILRALMREYVSDMYQSKLDYEKEINRNDQLINISYARVLAKLGYSDQANEILKDASTSIKKPGHFFPLSLAILHSHYEATRMEQLDPVYFKDSLNYSYFLRGLKKKLKDNKVENLLTNLSYFQLPLGEELEELSIDLNNTLLNIRGWLSPSEASILHFFASQVSEKDKIVEIGSFYGRSTVSLGLGSKKGNNSKIIAIDPHIGINAYNSSSSFHYLTDNLNKLRLSNVYIDKRKSLEAANSYTQKDIGLLFIDALHDYDNVKNDFYSWEKKIVHNGYILFHDIMLPGVNKFVLELLGTKNLNYQALGFRDSIFILKKNKFSNKNNEQIANLIKEYGTYHNKWSQDDKESILWRIKYFLNITANSN